MCQRQYIFFKTSSKRFLCWVKFKCVDVDQASQSFAQFSVECHVSFFPNLYKNILCFNLNQL